MPPIMQRYEPVLITDHTGQWPSAKLEMRKLGHGEWVLPSDVPETQEPTYLLARIRDLIKARLTVEGERDRLTLELHALSSVSSQSTYYNLYQGEVKKVAQRDRELVEARQSIRSALDSNATLRRRLATIGGLASQSTPPPLSNCDTVDDPYVAP